MSDGQDVTSGPDGSPAAEGAHGEAGRPSKRSRSSPVIHDPLLAGPVEHGGPLPDGPASEGPCPAARVPVEGGGVKSGEGDSNAIAGQPPVEGGDAQPLAKVRRTQVGAPAADGGDRSAGESDSVNRSHGPADVGDGSEASVSGTAGLSSPSPCMSVDTPTPSQGRRHSQLRLVIPPPINSSVFLTRFFQSAEPPSSDGPSSAFPRAPSPFELHTPTFDSTTSRGPVGVSSQVLTSTEMADEDGTPRSWGRDDGVPFGGARLLYPILQCTVPLSAHYQFSKSNVLGEGTYGAVYSGVSKVHPNRRVALKRLKQLPNFEGFPLTSVREIGVHRYLQSQPEERRAKLLVMEDLRFEYQPSGSDDSKVEEPRATDAGGSGAKAASGMSCGQVDVYLVFPYVEHTLASLRRFLRHPGTPPTVSLRPDNEQFVLHIFVQVLEGLQQLHNADIMHRDVKEDNILVTSDGDVKICDFGLAMPLSGERKRITPSLINMFYRPPEMLLGLRRYTTAVDVWSAGCLLAQQFLGVPPFISSDWRPGTDLEQLQRVVGVLGPLPRRLLDDESCPVSVREALLAHPSADRLVESATGGARGSRQEDFHFSKWFKKTLMLRRSRQKLPLNTPLPSEDTLRKMEQMLELDPARRIKVDELLLCRCPRIDPLITASLRDAVSRTAPRERCWICRAKAAGPFIRREIQQIPIPQAHRREAGA